MENILKIYRAEIFEDARRQFVDANSAFTAWEAARKAATEVKGGMFWKHQTERVIAQWQLNLSAICII